MPTIIIKLLYVAIASFLFGLIAVLTSGMTGWIPLIALAIVLISSFFNKIKKLSKTIPLKLVRYASYIFFLYSVGMLAFGFLCTVASSLNMRFASQKARFPLSQVEWIQIDNDGSVYCMSFSYFRMQVYNSDGEFQRGWFMPRLKGSYRVSLTEQGEILYGNENDVEYVFDGHGNQIPSKEDYVLSPLPPKSTRYVDENGSIYELRHSLFRPMIVKTDKDGNEVPLVKDPLGLWVHGMPLPGMGFLILSVAFILFGVGIMTPEDRDYVKVMVKRYRERRQNRIEQETT